MFVFNTLSPVPFVKAELMLLEHCQFWAMSLQLDGNGSRSSIALALPEICKCSFFKQKIIDLTVDYFFVAFYQL